MTRCLLVAAMLLSGCATKKDIRLLREDLNLLSLRQDSALAILQQQNRLLLDSIRSTMELTVGVRGETSSQLRAFTERMRELNGTLEAMGGSLQSIERRLGALEDRPAYVPPTPGGGGVSAGADARVMYDQGMQELRAGNVSTARFAFEGVVQQFPQDSLAAHAQLQLGALLATERKYAEAYAAFDVVPTRWPRSPAAPAALLQAGIVAQEQERDRNRARTFFERVVRDYSNTDFAGEAQRRLRQIRS